MWLKDIAPPPACDVPPESLTLRLVNLNKKSTLGDARMVPEQNGLLARKRAVRRENEILRDANIALNENLSLDRVLEALLDYLTLLVPYDSANVMLRRGDSQFVVSALRRYEAFQDVATTRAITFDGNTNPILRRICMTKKSVVVPDTNDEPEWQ